MGAVTQRTSFNKTKDQKSKVYCSKCKGATNHAVLQSVDSRGSETIGGTRDHPETIDWSDHYQIIRCDGCESITFRHVNWFSEDAQLVSEDEWSDGSSETLYPKRSGKTRPTKDYYNVPNTLRRIYRETIDCFNNDSLTLCAAGLRAMIEGICADQKVTDGPVEAPKKGGGVQIVRRDNLEGKIAGLCEKGILTQSNAAILQEHRFLGNEAVHELNQPSFDELTLAIDIMDHTLDALYEMPDKAEELKLIKAKRIKKQNQQVHGTR